MLSPRRRKLPESDAQRVRVAARFIAPCTTHQTRRARFQTFGFSATTLAILLAIIGVLWEVHPSPNHVHAQETPKGAPEPDLALADSTFDGPHVFWRSADTVTILYYCDGASVRSDLPITDTIRFTGLCSDSNTQYAIPSEPPAVGPDEFAGVSKILAVSDIHGEYEIIVSFLRNAGVIDKALHWIWGDGHLVFVGDIPDRGDRVTECLWLIYRLEQEAKRSGGRVHLVLGNHEVMVMQSDLRYVNDKYTRKESVVRQARITYEDLYGPGSELGRWLRTKHTLLKINEILFVHGGLHPDLATGGWTMERINETIRANLDTRSDTRAFDEEVNFLFRSKGPLWYRGFHYDLGYPKATAEDVQSVLDHFNVRHIAVGHTEVERITALYDGGVLAIHTPRAVYDTFEGLLWQDGNLSVITITGSHRPLE